MNRPSKRFNSNRWTEFLVPVLLAVLFLGLLGSMIIVILSVLGLTPGF